MMSALAAAPSLSQDLAPGADEYQRHCAPCHGLEGRGDGPLAQVLNRAPSDLTLIARRNGGKFPEDHVYRMMDGRRMILAHGTREMPIWGRRYSVEAARKQDRDGTEAEVRARILELVRYLRSIQTP
jgi:mono/diheme cytochrome c family protein